MSAPIFQRKYLDLITRILASLALCAVTAALILAFKSGVLPHSADGDAFDTIYAVEESADAV